MNDLVDYLMNGYREDQDGVDTLNLSNDLYARTIDLVADAVSSVCGKNGKCSPPRGYGD